MVTHSTPPRGLRTIAEPEALALAGTATVGRLAHVHEGRLVVTPVNFLLERRDVLLRTADGAELLDAARLGAAAVLEVDDLVEWSRSGWSVLVRGHLVEVTDPDEVRAVLGGELRPWAGPGRDHVVRLVGDEVTGRRIEPGPGGTTYVVEA